MNEIQNQTSQTPIEIALGIDADGKTTAKKLYEFLELNPRNYARWCKTNITENLFAEEGIDYYSSSMKSEGKGNFAQDFKLSANFAKKLSMQGKTEKAEQARDYFITVEDKLKQAATVLKLPELICMADVEEKEPYARFYKTDSGGIVLMNDMVFNLAPSEMEHLSRFISELEKQDIEHIEYVVSSFLKSMKKSRKLEEIASWGLRKKEEQKTLLQDKAVQQADIR